MQTMAQQINEMKITHPKCFWGFKSHESFQGAESEVARLWPKHTTQIRVVPSGYRVLVLAR
jgi:hypothetical protein